MAYWPRLGFSSIFLYIHNWCNEQPFCCAQVNMNKTVFATVSVAAKCHRCCVLKDIIYSCMCSTVFLTCFKGRGKDGKGRLWGKLWGNTIKDWCMDVIFFLLFVCFLHLFLYLEYYPRILPGLVVVLCVDCLQVNKAVCFHRLVGLVVKASASRAEGPGFERRWRRDFFWGRVIPVT